MDFICRLSVINRVPQSLKPPAPACIVVLILLSKYKCTTNMVRISHLHFLETVGYIFNGVYPNIFVAATFAHLNELW
jgi:hypothetical protein